jgi:hypothetical protein
MSEDKYDKYCESCCKIENPILYNKIYMRMRLDCHILLKQHKGPELGYKCEDCRKFYQSAKNVCSKCYLKRHGIEEYLSIFKRDRKMIESDIERDYVKNNVLEVFEEFKSENKFYQDAQIFTDKQYKMLLRTIFSEDDPMIPNRLFQTLIGQGDMFNFVLMLTGTQAEEILRKPNGKKYAHEIASFVLDPWNIKGIGGTYECYYQTDSDLWPTKEQIKQRWATIPPEWTTVDAGVCTICYETLELKGDMGMNMTIASYCENNCKTLCHFKCLTVKCKKCKKPTLEMESVGCIKDNSGNLCTLPTMKISDMMASIKK